MGSKKNVKFFHIFFDIIFSKNKKAFGAVVATALLIVVTVLAVISFQTWYHTYSSNILVQTEQNFENFNSLKIQGVIGNSLYLKSDGSQLTSLEIISSNGTSVCSLSDFNLNSDSSVNLTSGLVGWWKLNDEDSVIYDYSGNGNDGKLYGNSKLLADFDDGTANDKTSYDNNGIVYGASWTEDDCVSGGCYEFDGVNDFIDFGNGTLLNNSCDFSIGGWFRIQNYGDFNFLLGIGDIRSGLDPFYIRFYNSSIFDLAVTDTFTDNGVGIVWNFDSSDIPINNWNQYFVTLDSDSLKLYMNGNLVREVENTDNICLTYDQAMPIQIGSIANWTYFNGSLDEVSIYSKTLTEEEVNDLYTSRKVQFIEFKDSPLDKAVEFDGIDDYIVMGNNHNLDMGLNNLTVVTYYNNYGSYATLLGKSWFLPYYTLSAYPNLIFANETDVLYSDNPGFNLNWNLISGVFDRSGNMSLYYNNELLDTKDISSSNSVNVVNDNDFALGANCYRCQTDIGNFFNGQIDEVKIYNRILSQQEISKLNFNSVSKTNDGLNTINLESCDLIKGEKYEVFVATNTSIVESYFIAK